MDKEQPKAHYVYVLRCVDGTLYTGYTTNIERRLSTHNAGKGGSYTRSHRPVTLVAQWQFVTKREALRTEYAIKQLSHPQKLNLIATRSSETIRGFVEGVSS
jgi:putative endonuclease